LTVTGTAVALFVFCLVASVQEGLQRLTENEDSERTLIVFQENRFCPTTSRLPEDYARRIGELPGVRNVMPVQVWTNNCRASLDIVVFHGASPRKIRETRSLNLDAGGWRQFETQRDAAIIGRHVAQRRGLEIGDRFAIGPLDVAVAGIFSSPIPAEENLIYTSLEYLQYTEGRDTAGLVTLHEVHLSADADPDAVAREIDAMLRSGPVATKTRRKGAFQSATLEDLVDLVGFAHWLGYACVALVLSLVATTTVMAVQDRIQEHAVLQTLGLRPSGVFQLIVAESLLQGLLGGLFGTVAASVLLSVGGLAIGAEGVTVAFRPSLTLLVMGVGVSLLVGLLGGLMPAWQASRTNIVDALRQV
jgi:putative ABC transport system permease protein